MYTFMVQNTIIQFELVPLMYKPSCYCLCWFPDVHLLSFNWSNSEMDWIIIIKNLQGGSPGHIVISLSL